MANYSLSFKKSVAKDLCGIPNSDVKRILQRIEALAENPSAEGCIKLSALERYRVRQGLTESFMGFEILSLLSTW